MRRLIDAQIPRDGVIVDVEMQRLRNVAKQALFNKVLGKLTHRIDMVDIKVEIAWLGIVFN